MHLVHSHGPLHFDDFLSPFKGFSDFEETIQRLGAMSGKMNTFGKSANGRIANSPMYEQTMRSGQRMALDTVPAWPLISRRFSKVAV